MNKITASPPYEVSLPLNKNEIKLSWCIIIAAFFLTKSSVNDYAGAHSSSSSITASYLLVNRSIPWAKKLLFLELTKSSKSFMSNFFSNRLKWWSIGTSVGGYGKWRSSSQPWYPPMLMLIVVIPPQTSSVWHDLPVDDSAYVPPNTPTFLQWMPLGIPLGETQIFFLPPFLKRSNGSSLIRFFRTEFARFAAANHRKSSQFLHFSELFETTNDGGMVHTEVFGQHYLCQASIFFHGCRKCLVVEIGGWALPFSLRDLYRQIWTIF